MRQKNKFSENIKTALKDILESIISPSIYYVKRAKKDVKGLGTRNKMLIRNICSKEEMKEIRESYKQFFEKEMIDDIKG